MNTEFNLAALGSLSDEESQSYLEEAVVVERAAELCEKDKCPRLNLEAVARFVQKRRQAGG